VLTDGGDKSEIRNSTSRAAHWSDCAFLMQKSGMKFSCWPRVSPPSCA